MRRFLLFVIFGFAFAFLCALGFWQLHRAEEKRLRYDTFTERLNAAPLGIDMIARHTPPAEYLWRRTEVTGRYLETQVLVDNRIVKGKAGYEVLTPFISRGGVAVLVNRGWIPMDGKRDRIPDIPTPAGELTVNGFLGAEPVVGIELPGAEIAVERMGPHLFRSQRTELPELETLLERELWPALIYLEAGAPGALAVEFTPPGDGSAKHTAYAVQWFGMAAVLAAIGLWNLRRRDKGADA